MLTRETQVVFQGKNDPSAKNRIKGLPQDIETFYLILSHWFFLVILY